MASGRYQQAEFAADLGQVHRGEGGANTASPGEFFRRTFLTEGLRHLLISALRRLHGTGRRPGRGAADQLRRRQDPLDAGPLPPVLGGTPATELPGVEAVLKEAGVARLPKARRAVLVGTHLSPAQPSKKPDGTVVRTLWGELAWQLGGAEGYALVAEADRTGISPGSQCCVTCSPPTVPA